MQPITPFLWFNDNAEEAVNFYLSIFANSKIIDTTRQGPSGSVLAMKFQLNGMDFVALNGGPHYTFTPAVSFVVNCETQSEVDHYWDKLLDGGKPSQCGWLADKYGLSWQIVPSALTKVLQGKDRAGAARAMQAMMKMIKLDVAELERAYNGE